MTHFLSFARLMTDALRRRLDPLGEAPGPDPMDDPALRRMTPRELADLPWPRPAPRQGGVDALGPCEPPPQEPHDLRPAA